MKKIFCLLIVAGLFTSCAGTNYYTRTIPGLAKCGFEKNMDKMNNQFVFNHGEKQYHYAKNR